MDTTIFDTEPVEFNPFDPPETPAQAGILYQPELENEFNCHITPIDFDPFEGPEISQVAPVTESQMEIWMSCLIGGTPANCAYNECVSLLLTGKFHKDAMAQALQRLAARHQALRMVFSADGASACIYKELQPDIDYRDLSAMDTKKQQAFIKDYNKKNVETPFDLVNGPLFKTALFKLSDKVHYLTFTAHHIICDGWSIGIMMQDLSKMYSALVQNLQISLADAPIFSDYALGQMKLAESTLYKENEIYWLNQFKGSDHVMNLPIDLPRPATRTYKSHREDFVLDGALTNEVKKLGKSTGSSFVTTLLAAFEVFLQRQTRQDEVIIGLPAAGQSATDNYGLVGHCVNLLPLRSTPSGDISFIDYLRQRRAEVLDAYDHQLYTFGSLLKKLNIARDPSRVPLVPVMFNIDMGLDDDVEFYELEHKLISNPREFENFELFLNIAGQDESPTLEWSYNTDLFEPATIKKMMDDFEFLLREVVSQPEILIKNIPLVNEKEILNKLAAWNDTQYPYPMQIPLHKLLHDRATEVSGKTAITFGKQKTTYKKLDETANQLAALLIKNGVKKGDKVAFTLDRSVEMVTVILAIMKIGAIYLPLDPLFPMNRINYMLEDSQAVVLLTSEKYRGVYQSNASELLIEEIWPKLKDFAKTEPAVEVTGDDLVYILYTSGSTGNPKGVQISHKNLVNFLYSMQNAPGMTAEDKLLAVTTISFDIAGLELFLPLLTGAEIVLADKDTAKDGRALLDIIKKERITVMQATPYTWRILLEAGWGEDLPIKVICGGEAMPQELAQRLLSRASSLWNVYGPTETTVWSTVKQLSAGDKVISIGRPINNTSIYILDKFAIPLEPGVAGEIYIGGDGVAKGYLNRPELTAEKFIDDPFSKIPGSKMYRTGDLGRFLPDGEIECLGRIDAQVKIRGYRIETGEIEFQLAKEADVKEAVVIARPDKNGVDKLVAFVVMNLNGNGANTNVHIQGWRDKLKDSLPDYMIPDNFIVVPEMPLTPNGKVDKKELAKHGESTTNEQDNYIGPRTDIEKLVADIWIESLGIKRVGVHDDFFELGGHSLIAVQVMAKIEKQTGKRLPLATLFESPTVEKLACTLELGGKTITWDSLVPIKPKGSKMPLYMVHGAGLNVLLFNTLAMNMSEEQPVYGLQAKGLNGVDEPLGKIEDIATHYIEAIMDQNPTGPYALAGYSFGGIIAYEMARQFEALGKEVKMVAMFDTYAYRSPFHDPALTRLYKRGTFFMKKVLYTFTFSNGFKYTVIERGTNVKRRIIRLYWKLRHGKNQSHAGIFGYSNKVDVMNAQAEKRYILRPYSIEIEVFRAENRTFYMDDPEFLGWKPYALKGVNIHPIPGEHNTIFKSPNDKIFAEKLQKCLDEAINR